MSNESELGKKWVKETFEVLGKEWNIAPKSYGWKDPSPGDRRKREFPFEVKSAHGHDVIVFSEEDIDDCVNDESVRKRLSRKIEELVQRHSPRSVKGAGLKRAED